MYAGLLTPTEAGAAGAMGGLYPGHCQAEIQNVQHATRLEGNRGWSLQASSPFLSGHSYSAGCSR